MVSDEQAEQESHDTSPRKAVRLTHRKNQSSGAISTSASAADGSAPVDWSVKRTASRMSDSEQTSASSSRIQISHSRTSSTGETGAVEGRQSVGDASGRGRNTNDVVALQEVDEEQGSNYTWRSERDDQRRREAGEGAEIKSDGSPASGSNRLPPVTTGFRSMAAPPAPSMASYTHNSSPSPRLPSFASLHSSSQQQRPAEDAAISPRSGPRHTHSTYSAPHYQSPRQGPHSSTSAHSPSLSQTSQAQQLTPGQAFIHPALAGLPGAGGVAGSKQQPSFVSKLYSMLEDETIEDMIAWGPSGTVFSVANPAEFSKVVLPNWFKHSNWQSFVRQLNMYGFHKVNHTYQGTPEEEIQVWEFKHPSFRRGEIQLLNDIKRKSSRHKRQGSINQSMTNVGEFEAGARSPISGTPSPEIPLSHLAPPGARNMPSGQQMHHQYSQQHQQHLAPHHQHRHASRSGGVPSGFPAYREFNSSGVPSHHPHPQRPLSPSAAVVYGSGSGEQVAAKRGTVEETASGMIASESAAVRMDDLSDRIDAIIRHASYLESQLRSVSDQLYQSQQNEVNLGRHIQHLESKVMAMEDHIRASGPSLLSVPHPSHKRAMSPAAASAPSASPLAGAGGSSGRAAYPSRSPMATHPSYSSSYTRGASALTHSSADAYQKLPPPPPSSLRREEAHSPAAESSGDKRYRD